MLSTWTKDPTLNSEVRGEKKRCEAKELILEWTVNHDSSGSCSELEA